MQIKFRGVRKDNGRFVLDEPTLDAGCIDALLKNFDMRVANTIKNYEKANPGQEIRISTGGMTIRDKIGCALFAMTIEEQRRAGQI